MAPSPQKNRLLARLAPKDFDALRPHLEAVDFAAALRAGKAGAGKIENVFFPESGIASVVAVQANETRIEVGLIGCEGMSGIAVVLGNHQSPNETYIQVCGAGQRISVGALREATAKSAGMHGIMLKYVQAFLTQTAHTAICNARSHIDERLARWILMAHDRDQRHDPAHPRISLADARRAPRRRDAGAAMRLSSKVSSNPRADRLRCSIARDWRRARAIPTACPRPNTAACSANDLYGIEPKEFSHFRPASLTPSRVPKRVSGSPPEEGARCPRQNP